MPIRRLPGLSLNIPTSGSFNPEQTTAEQNPSSSSSAQNPPPALKHPNIPLQSHPMPQHLASLHQELQNVRSDIEGMRQPGRKTLNADLSNVRSIVESENRLKSGLNLRYFGDSHSFAQALSTAAPGARRERAVFRVDNRPGGPHHAVADIRHQSGKPPTLFVVEPTTMGIYDHLFSHQDLVRNIRAYPGLKDARIAVIDAGAQKSPADCVIFSLSFASKMHKEEALFDDWHEKLAKGESIGPQTDGKKLASGEPIIDGLQVLPNSFFKHAHSMTQLFEQRPQIAHAPLGSESTSSGSAKTLSERKERYSQQRFTAEGQRTYNASIEFKRYNLLRRSIEMAANTDTPSDDVGRKRKQEDIPKAFEI